MSVRCELFPMYVSTNKISCIILACTFDRAALLLVRCRQCPSGSPWYDFKMVEIADSSAPPLRGIKEEVSYRDTDG